MPDTSITEEVLEQKAGEGDLSAHDALGTIMYNRWMHIEAAEHYMKAHIGGYYKNMNHSQSIRNFNHIYEDTLIPKNSDAYRYVQNIMDEADRSEDVKIKVSVAGFFGYMLLVYLGGIDGFLRDYSLWIAIAIGWGLFSLQ